MTMPPPDYQRLTVQRELMSRYTIERELGRGGAAIVYLARDLKHDRHVAIKVLRQELTGIVSAERFLREIRVAAALQHPHILPLYDSGEADGILFYVMPFVQGGSLRQRLDRDRQLTIEELPGLIGAIAAALQYAHANGVIHRDIKPENILLQEGQPLLADFGLALAIGGADSERLTNTGLSLGTPQYMSPEQAGGERNLTPQTDIYSLAAVAYEMLVGEPPTTGPSVQAIIARIMTDPPRSIRSVRSAVEPAVERAILRGLAKTPVDRWRSADEFARALAGEHSVPALRRRFTARAAIIGLAAVAVVASAIPIGRMFARQTPRPPPVQRQLTFTGNAQTAALAPDAQFLAYVAQVGDSQNVVVQDLSAASKPDTIFSSSNIATLEWSPDGTQLLVGAYVHPANPVAILPRLGGAPRRLNVPEASFAHWLPDGSHISVHDVRGRRILLVDLRSSDTSAIGLPGQYEYVWQGAWSRDGLHFSVATQSIEPLRWQIRILSRDGRMSVVAEDSVPLASPHWSSDGKAVYYSRASEAVWKVGVSPRSGERTDAPQEIRPNLEALPVNYGALQFSASRDGRRMAYGRGLKFSNIWLVAPGPDVQHPRMQQLTQGTALRWSAVVSPDERWIAFAQQTSSGAEVFRMPIDGGTISQITTGAQVQPYTFIAWSPDGRRVAFQTVRAGRSQVWTASAADGTVQRFEHTSSSTIYGELAWAPGARIAYLRADQHNFHLIDPASGRETVIAADTGIHIWDADSPGRLTADAARSYLAGVQYSPDGNRLAMLWIHTWTLDMWAVDLRDSTYAKVADQPLWIRGWSSDARYLYGQFTTGGSTIYRIDVQRGGAEPIVALPFREARCSPVRRRNAFLCVAFDFTSDAWMIENFDSNIR